MTLRPLSLLLLPLVALPAEAQPLTDASFARYRSYILPKAAELQFMTIPWRPTLWQAVLEGQKRVSPILLWAMNGHPLTCT
jgi:hypothetical protein